ncbi:MAG TPA: hypothetical protein VGE24_12680 [Emticicia sp.]
MTTTETENTAALQLKIQHYTEMALHVLEGVFEIPKGFSVITTAEGVHVRFVKGIAEYFDENSKVIFKENEYEEKEYLADPDGLVNIYVFLWDCIEEARVADRHLKEAFRHV